MSAPMHPIVCVGLGPGDPELMSVKAARAIGQAQQVAYFCKRGTTGRARQIVEGLLPPDIPEHPMEYPLTTEAHFSREFYRDTLASFYDAKATHLLALARNAPVSVLCEGDPLFYGSFMHLYIRLQGRAEMEIIPGITGMSGCWTATGQPVTWGDDALLVLMATLPEMELIERAAQAEALVFMKVGRNLPKVVRALRQVGRYEDAWLVEKGTMPGQRVIRLAEVTGEVPYFSIVIAHGQGRRPGGLP